MREKRSDAITLFQRPYAYLLLISVSSYVIYLILLWTVPSLRELRGGFLSLGISVVGAFFTVFLVDRVFRQRDQREKNRLQEIALEQLSQPLNSHLSFLTTLYVVSIPELPNNPPSQYKDLFTEEYVESVQYLDFSKRASVMSRAGSVTWLRYSEVEFRKFKQKINEIIGKYGTFMSSEGVRKLEQISTSEMMEVVIGASERDFLKLSQILQSEHGIEGDLNIFSGEGMQRAVRDHIEAVSQLIDYYDSSSSDLTPADQHSAWRADHVPRVGDARIEKRLEDTTPLVAGSSGLSSDSGTSEAPDDTADFNIVFPAVANRDSLGESFSSAISNVLDAEFRDKNVDRIIKESGLFSPASAIILELFTATEPISAAEISELVDTDRDSVSEVARTLAQFNYILTDSRTPTLSEEARFIANPALEQAAECTAIVRLVNDGNEIEEAINRHKKQVETFRNQTDFDTAGQFNAAVFDDEEDTAKNTEENRIVALQWILTESSLDTLERARDRYDSIAAGFDALEQDMEFVSKSVNPPEMEREDYLYPPQPPFL